MKTLFKRLICIVVAIMLCVSSMHIIYSFATEEPQLSSKCETIIELNGKEANFGESTDGLRTNSRIKYTSNQDLSAMDAIELSVYIDNYIAIRNALGKNQKIRLSFSSSAVKENLATSSAHAVISDQLTEHGWNTVLLKKSDFVGTINWEKIRYIYLSFADESLELAENIRNKPIYYKNVCDVVAIPEITDGGVTVFNDGVINSLGEDENSTVADIKGRIEASFDSVNAEDVDIFKTDIFVPDFTSFSALIANNDLKVALKSGDKEAVTNGKLTMVSNANVGWYTVTFAKANMLNADDFDFSDITGAEIYFEGAGSADALGSAYSLRIGFANIRGLKLASNEIDEVYGEVLTDYDLDKVASITQDTLESSTVVFESDLDAIETAENIEFDFYINDYTSFKESFKFDAQGNPISAALDLKLTQGDKDITFSGIENQVLANGWNHVILKVADGVNNGFDIDKDFDGITLVYNSSDLTVNSTYSGNYMVIDNFVTTKGLPEGSAKFDTIVDLLEDAEAVVGNTFENSTISGDITSTDITGVKFVEFDIYVQNFTAFKTVIAEKGITDIKLTLSSADGSVSAGILGQITQNGWNHITASYTKFATETGTFNIAEVTGVKLVFAGAVDVATDEVKGYKFAIKEVSVADVVDPELPEEAEAILSEEGISGVYGEKYDSVIANSMIDLAEPVDATVAGNLEFDFYVEDYERFQKLLSNSSKPLYIALGTDADSTKKRAMYEFSQQIIGDGWNHIELTVTGYKGDSDVDLKNVQHVFLTFGDETKDSTEATLSFKVMNICIALAEYEDIPQAPEHDFILLEDMGIKTWGDNCNWIQDRALVYFDEPKSITGFDKVEFDIYIENYENYQKMAESSKRDLMLCLNTNADQFKQRATFAFEDQITHQGWNHIVVKAKNVGGDGSPSFGTVYGLRLHYWDESTANPCKSDILRVANVVGSYAAYTKNPALPENVIAQLGTQAGNTVGDFFHYTQDRIFQEKLTPVDFSLSPVVEFDIYIDDYEVFLAAQNDPEDGQNSKLAFVVSSTPVALWGQYDKPRMYYNAEIELEKYITKEGWNHVVVGQPDFTTKNHGVDWSKVTGFYVYYKNSSNFSPYRNKNGNLYVKVANVVNTGVIANIPADKDKPLQSDKKAVYISSVEGMSDDNGSWNTLIGGISTKYKTEGKASLLQENDYNSDPSTAFMYYIFDDTADMSDLKTLKFDFFADLPQNLNKPTNNIEILIGNNRFAEKDYYAWNMDLTKIKAGWNSISLDIKDAKKVGDPDLTEAKVIMLRFTEFDFDAENFEKLNYGIDNLRYISSTGNKILKVEGWDENLEDDTDDNNNVTPENEEPIIEDTTDDYDDSYISDDYEIVDDEDTDNVQQVETVVNKTDKVKYNKIVQDLVVVDYLVAAIILGIEAVVLAAGVVVFMLIYRKKLKK